MWEKERKRLGETKIERIIKVIAFVAALGERM